MPVGGKDNPLSIWQEFHVGKIHCSYVNPIDRPAHDFVVDANYFKENMMGGDHEFKFGFEYKTSKLHTFSSYGNGVLHVDYNQTTPRGPLTSGYAKVQHFVDGRVTDASHKLLCNRHLP